MEAETSDVSDKEILLGDSWMESKTRGEETELFEESNAGESSSAEEEQERTKKAKSKSSNPGSQASNGGYQKSLPDSGSGRNTSTEPAVISEAVFMSGFVSGPDSVDANAGERILSHTDSRRRKQIDRFIMLPHIPTRKPRRGTSGKKRDASESMQGEMEKDSIPHFELEEDDSFDEEEPEVQPKASKREKADVDETSEEKYQAKPKKPKRKKAEGRRSKDPKPKKSRANPSKDAPALSETNSSTEAGEPDNKLSKPKPKKLGAKSTKAAASKVSAVVASESDSSADPIDFDGKKKWSNPLVAKKLTPTRTPSPRTKSKQPARSLSTFNAKKKVDPKTGQKKKVVKDEKSGNDKSASQNTKSGGKASKELSEDGPEEMKDEEANKIDVLKGSKTIGSLGKAAVTDPDHFVDGDQGPKIVRDVGEQEEKLARMKELSSAASGLVEERNENSMDYRHPLQILPAEMWKEVAKRVDDVDDLYNLAKSSTFFEDLLSPKVLYLFPTVWDILGKKFLENYRKPGVSNLDRLSELLKLRLVSKRLNKAVERFIGIGILLDDDDQAVPQDESKLYKWMYGYSLYSWTDGYRFTRFHRHFDETHAVSGDGLLGNKNPFLSGSAEVVLGGDPAPVMDMLQLYGHHVHRCLFQEWDGEPTPVAAYSLYRQAIELMPNLKVLKTSLRNHWNVKHERQLQIEMALRPMPFLKDLQLLKLNGNNAEIFKSVLRNNGHVATLILAGSWLSDIDIWTSPLPCLKRLGIFYGNFSKKLRELEFKLNLNLTHLDLTYLIIPEQISVMFDGISRSCGGTLTNLRIAFLNVLYDNENPGYQKEFDELTIHLPYLKMFLFETRYCCSLEFLLPVKQTLEYLEVTFNDASEGSQQMISKERSIKFMSCIHSENRSLLDSNIWELFPKLTEVKYTQNISTSIRMNRREWQFGKGKM